MINLYNGEKKAKAIGGVAIKSWEYRDSPVFKLDSYDYWFVASRSPIRVLIGERVRVFSFNNFEGELINFGELEQGVVEFFMSRGKQGLLPPIHDAGCEIDGFVKFDERGRLREGREYKKELDYEFREE